MIPGEIEVRDEKRQTLIALGIDPYPTESHRTASCKETHDAFETWEAEQRAVTVAGRVRTTRLHGAILFADLEDETGKIQMVLKEDLLGDAFVRARDLVDPGDILEATGTVFLTKRGEQSLQITSWRMLTKALLPLPDKWHGLSDIELRFRKRYLDLLMSEEVGQRMRARSNILFAIRSHLHAQGFIEVETPTLQPIYGGGFARPFVTHHHALEADFYLRISSEMYLKRLQVAGWEKVFDIKKVFRNEGIDHDHNPEFTMFEAQIAYADYRDGMELFESIFEHAATEAIGTTDVVHGDVTVHLARPWKRMTMSEAVVSLAGIDWSAWSSLEDAVQEMRTRLSDPRKVQELERLGSIGEVLAFAFEELVEEQLIQPTIIYDYPVEVSPLAKRGDDPRFVQRFEAFALGSEIGNNYTELNDPIDLEKRFIEEKKKHAAGFEEAHQTDEDYLEAIRHGLPPSVGLGIGIDRMVMLLTGAKNIKEVILFPTLRPERSLT